MDSEPAKMGHGMQGQMRHGYWDVIQQERTQSGFWTGHESLQKIQHKMEHES
jgi:hypothetical protein